MRRAKSFTPPPGGTSAIAGGGGARARDRGGAAPTPTRSATMRDNAQRFRNPVIQPPDRSAAERRTGYSGKQRSFPEGICFSEGFSKSCILAATMGRGKNNEFVIDGSDIVVPRMRYEGVSPLPEVRAGGDGGASQKGDRFHGTSGAPGATATG